MVKYTKEMQRMSVIAESNQSVNGLCPTQEIGSAAHARKGWLEWRLLISSRETQPDLG